MGMTWNIHCPQQDRTQSFHICFEASSFIAAEAGVESNPGLDFSQGLHHPKSDVSASFARSNTGLEISTSI